MGPRLAVDIVVELLANVWSEQQLMANDRGIERDDIYRCLPCSPRKFRGSVKVRNSNRESPFKSPSYGWLHLFPLNRGASTS